MKSSTPKNNPTSTRAAAGTAAGLSSRPPIVVVMGHIDHGKSTLLDYIRKTNTTDKEAGGITQHVSAYEALHTTADGVEHAITFLDTPGHEAFQALRTRGARVADIAILVVSAEDGVKPQTVEAYKAISEGGIPYIVAINKIDRPGANIDRAKQSLAENEIYVEGYGGTIPTVPISAKTGEGVPELLEMIELVSSLAELKADHSPLAEGIAVESNLDPKKGIAAVVIIKNGTLKSGTFIAAGSAIAPVRMMENTLGKNISEVTFSSPVKIFGWSELVAAGSPFKTFENKKEAIEFAEKNAAEKAGAKTAEKNAERTATAVTPLAPEIPTVNFPLVIKADTTGTLEAINYEIAKIKKDERVTIKVLSQRLGAIGEGDVKLASTDKSAAVLGFNVKTDNQAQSLAERDSVPIKVFSIIYELKDWIEAELSTRTPKTKTEEITGKARILKIFSKTKDRQIVGGKVDQGFLALGEHVKIVRRESDIGTGRIRELQQQKQSAKEIKEGTEFGALVESKIEIASGDVLVSFTIVEK
ncbi:MAG: translation initiation factor IF-2 [Patescibacteria group bacterium]